jgi:uncharacterized membrane protein
MRRGGPQGARRKIRRLLGESKMLEVLTAGVLLIVTHFGLSSTAIRPALVAKLGEQGFLGVYSLVSLATFGLLIYAYATVPRYEYAWFPNPDLHWVTKVVMPLATILLLGGFMVRNPTQVGMEKLLEGGTDTRGLLRITRHPFLWAVILWSLSHIVVNGDFVSLAFFGTFLVLGGLGTVLLDRKKAAKLGANWAAFASVTSNIPFAAIFAGRNRFVPAELWLPGLVGLAGYALFYWLHEWIAGVPVI